MGNRRAVCGLLCVCVVSAQSTASGQVTELVGSSASGMGGAFVAVASDSSAVWWNPAGLAAGPFLDMALAEANLEVIDDGYVMPYLEPNRWPMQLFDQRMMTGWILSTLRDHVWSRPAPAGTNYERFSAYVEGFGHDDLTEWLEYGKRQVVVRLAEGFQPPADFRRDVGRATTYVTSADRLLDWLGVKVTVSPDGSLRLVGNAIYSQTGSRSLSQSASPAQIRSSRSPSRSVR